jgi:hypothetical protein
MELMAEWQWKRWDAMAQLAAGKLTMHEAVKVLGLKVLGLSVRRVRPIRRAVERVTRAGLLHGNRGRVPVNKLRAAVGNRMLRLRRATCRDLTGYSIPPTSALTCSGRPH